MAGDPVSPKPWHIDGPTSGKNAPGLEDALARLHEGRPGPASDDDRPPPSTLPMTKAARAALSLYYGGVRPSRRFPSRERAV